MICAECHREAFGKAFGWRCYRCGEDDELVFYCSFCALREYGLLVVTPLELAEP